MDEIFAKLRGFIDADGMLTALPAKSKTKKLALLYVGQKLCAVLNKDTRYSEREINAALNALTTFGDPATLRRELYDNRFLDRTNDCSAYWLETEQPTPAELGI